MAARCVLSRRTCREFPELNNTRNYIGTSRLADVSGHIGNKRLFRAKWTWSGCSWRQTKYSLITLGQKLLLLVTLISYFHVLQELATRKTSCYCKHPYLVSVVRVTKRDVGFV